MVWSPTKKSELKINLEAIDYEEEGETSSKEEDGELRRPPT